MTKIERAIDLLTPLADQQPVANTVFVVVMKDHLAKVFKS